MIQNERLSHAHNTSNAVVKTDEDYDIDDHDEVVIVLADSCRHDDDDEAAEPVELALPDRPRDGQSVRLIAAGQAFTLDGGNFAVGSSCCNGDDDDDEDPPDRVFPVGSAIDVVFADLSFNNCHGCGHCGCAKRSSCKCPKGRWFIVACIADPCPVAEAAAPSTLLASQLVFFPVVVPGFPPGLEIAIVVGDPFNPAATCQYFKYRVRFPAGYATPVHFFSKTTYVTVISRSLQHSAQGQEPTVLGPGDTTVNAPGSLTTNTTQETALVETTIEVTGVGTVAITAVP